MPLLSVAQTFLSAIRSDVGQECPAHRSPGSAVFVGWVSIVSI